MAWLVGRRGGQELDLGRTFQAAGMTDQRLSAPTTKTGRLQRACLDLLRQHQADGALPTSGRFIWYELEQRGVVDKTQARGHPGVRRGIDQDVTDALKHLRDVGIIPWGWIVDETRTLHEWQSADSVAAYLGEAVGRARIDCWNGYQPPLLLCESRSLAGVLRNLASEYLVPIAATNGQVGGFLHTDIGPSLVDGQQVLYLGDFDLSGDQIESNTSEVLYQYADLEWERLALTATQAEILIHEQYGGDRSRLVVIKKDNRYRPAREHEAIETEAYGQHRIADLVRARLDQLLIEPLADVLIREQREREKLAAALRRWGS